MSSRLYRVRCNRCHHERLVDTTLEHARQNICGACDQRMTVVGHEEAPEVTPGKPVEKPPAIEIPFWRLSPAEELRARRLVESALGGGQP